MFVIDVTNKDVMDGCEHWLEKECKESHDQCGIRGLDAGIILKLFTECINNEHGYEKNTNYVNWNGSVLYSIKV